MPIDKTNFFNLDCGEFEDIRDALLEIPTEEEAREYNFMVKGGLSYVHMHISTIVPEIIDYLKNIEFEDIHTPILPKIPKETLKDRMDFILGCYWILSEARIFTLDYQKHFPLLDQNTGNNLPDCRSHFEAVLGYSAQKKFGATRQAPLWPWPEQGNPFYE